MKCFVINVSSYFNIWAWESVITDGEKVEIQIQLPKDLSDTIRAVRHMKIDPKGILDQTVRVYASIGSVKARALLEHDLVVVGLQVAEAGREWEVYLGLKQAIHATFETSSKSRGINDHQAKDFFRKQLSVLLNYKDRWMSPKPQKKKIKPTDFMGSRVHNACMGLTLIDLRRYECFESMFFHLFFLEDKEVLNRGELIRFKMGTVGAIGGACTMGLLDCTVKLERGVG